MIHPASPLHHVTQFNCGRPIRENRPADLLHPHLHDVVVKHITFASSKLSISINSETPAESDTNTPPLCPKTSSLDNLASESNEPLLCEVCGAPETHSICESCLEKLR